MAKRMWIIVAPRRRKMWHTLAPTQSEAWAWCSEYRVHDGFGNIDLYTRDDLEEKGYRATRVTVTVEEKETE